MQPTTIDSFNRSNTLSPFFIETVQRGIIQKDRSTFDSILLACREAWHPDDIEKIFPLLLQALPDFNVEELIKFQEKTLPLLLENLSPFQQQAIALQFAKWYIAHPNEDWESILQSSVQAMHYAAKAIQIGTVHQKQSVKEIHLLAQKTFIRLIKHYLIKDDAFKKRLDSFRKITNEDMHGFETFTKYITQIDQLECFYFTEEDHNTKLVLYKQAAGILTSLLPESQEKYRPCFQQILQGLGKPFSLPIQSCTEKYADELRRFRDIFASLDTSKLQTSDTIRAFQKNIIEAFKNFFQTLLNDAFAILGPPSSTYKALKYSPPCTYDIRAMGSIGREEVCPYSDLEFMILIQDEKAFTYFKTLVHILEIQIASLGETSTTNPVFTCIHTKNPSGFHIDSSPTLNASLIQTPVAMAMMQNNPVDEPQTIENTVLKTISLNSTDLSLFTHYQTALEEPLTSCQEERAFKFFKIRLSDYKKHWKQHFNSQEDIINIKQHYVEVLNHLLSDIALFYGITKTNTLDIIDALIEMKIFTEESGRLVKESVATIYAIRIRLHTLYKEQKEEGGCKPDPRWKQLLPFEILALEKCYWLVLRPLYAQLQAITAPIEFKTTFKKIDLIQIAFNQNLSSQTVTQTFIIHLASHLCSDLEFMILIQDEKASPYFNTLVHILEIQIASLGETSTSNPVFTCIHTKNPSGFHIDSSPTLNASLIQTPVAMAMMQNNPVDEPQIIENTVLKTISLNSTDFSLFTDYQKALEEPLISFQEERAFKFFKIRLSDYKKHWKQHFNSQEDIINIKQDYVEILNHLLSDVALFYGITKTNTLDIIDLLIEIKIFTEESGRLVKESVAIIYAIRIRLHTLYKEQKEESSCKLDPRWKQLLSFEIIALEKCYWLVLRPLYTQLQAITTPIEFKTTFKEIDLIQIAFKQNLFSQTVTQSFINHLASHLCQINAPLETHLDYFKALSELPIEHPRQVYLEVLEKNHTALPFQRLLYVPNRAGLRPIFLKEYEWIKQGLTAITDPFDTQIPGQIVICITAPHFAKPRYLKPSLIAKIMDGENIKSEYTNSAHSVCALNDQDYHFHLKQKPSHPLMEYAIHNLSSRIAGKLTPSVELVRFEVHSKGRKKSYPVIISETIPGVNLKNTKGPYNPAQYTWMLLLAILTRPGDGRLSNYIVGDNGMLYCVDNDISFAEPVIKEYGMRTVYFCSALFCLTKLDTPLDVETLKEFSCLEGDSIFHAWIEDIIAKEQKYKSLFSKEEIDSLYTEDAKNTFTPTILFKKGTLATLSLQFWQLQNKVAYFLAEGKVMTVGDLLKELISLEEEAIGTFVYKAYNNAKATPEEKLQQATDRKQEHSITSIQSHQVCLGKVPTLQEIMTKQRYSPQKAKEEFFSTLLQGNSLHARIKSSQGKIVMEANFKELKQERRRQALILKALSEQFKMMRQKPTILILHHSNLLTGDILAPFLHNQSERLDLRYCEKIDNNDFSIIQKQCPNLKELSLAGCVGITNISGSFFNPKLTFPSLESLDVSYCTNLHTLKLETPLLGNLKGRNNPLLKQVELITWTAKIDFTESLEINLNHRSLAFGKQQWEDYFGDIGIEPPLPQDIHQILNSPCPFWSGKRVCDTHLFVLVPATVNGKPLTLDSLQKLIANPKKGYKTQYWFYSVSVKKELGPKSTSSHWVLMTRDVIPGSRDKPHEEQKKLVATYAKKSGWPYELPMALDAAVCILMEHVQTGTKLYSNNPWTYTLCQEKVKSNRWTVAIGGFAVDGLRADDNWNDDDRRGAGGAWRF